MYGNIGCDLYGFSSFATNKVMSTVEAWLVNGISDPCDQIKWEKGFSKQYTDPKADAKLREELKNARFKFRVEQREKKNGTHKIIPTENPNEKGFIVR